MTQSIKQEMADKFPNVRCNVKNVPLGPPSDYPIMLRVSGYDTDKVKAYAQQIAARIACNEVDLLLFFRDPLDPKPHEPNDINLLRLCDMHNIPVATNIATAEVLIHGLERGDLDWRNILNPRY